MINVVIDPQRQWTAVELRRLPADVRDAILAEAAARAVDEYNSNSELTAFSAFGEKDIHVQSSDTESR